MKIPAIVCDLIGKGWSWRDVHFGETAGVHEPIGNRYLRTTRASRNGGFSFIESEALVAADVFEPLSENVSGIEIDSQEEGALHFFLAEVAFAWSQYQKRLERIRERRDQYDQYEARMKADDNHGNQPRSASPRMMVLTLFV
jgi:hypothetical protein